MTPSQILKEELHKIRELCLSFPTSSKPIDEAITSLTKRIIESEVAHWKEELETTREEYRETRLQPLEGEITKLNQVIAHLKSELKLINEN